MTKLNVFLTQPGEEAERQALAAHQAELAARQASIAEEERRLQAARMEQEQHRQRYMLTSDDPGLT